MIGDKATKRHRDRKSEGSAEVWRKRKKALNAARPRQVWVGGPIVEGGHWERDEKWAEKWVVKDINVTSSAS